MRNCILFVTLLFSKAIIACECPNLQPISKEFSKDYNVIFYGKVDSVSIAKANGISIAYFTIDELYKGNVKQQVKVNFDASSSCMMSFARGEQWLMYCSFQRFDDLTASFCGHSRKYFSDVSQDFYQLAAQRTFDEEKQFLIKELGIQQYSKDNVTYQQQVDFKPHNEQPSVINKLLLLLTSFIAMIIVYFVTRKKDKNQ